jgi:foldase protein PrsA
MAALALGACAGGADRDSVIVRVGKRAITKDALAHWMSILAPQHEVPDPPRYAACVTRRQARRSEPALEVRAQCARSYRALEQQALELLISSDWLIGEAADRNLGVSRREIKQRLHRTERAFRSEAEFHESLEAIAHTTADSEFELEAELASSKIRRMLVSGEPALAATRVADYYRRNIRRFVTPERRYFSIAENLKSEAAARRLMREVAHGRSLADVGLRESLPRPNFAQIPGLKRIIYKAIFAAKPKVVAEPVELNKLYFVFEVTRVVPATLRSLAQARSAIAHKLRAERQRRTLAKFVRAWRVKWIAKTSCLPAYVVQKCKQYDGPHAREDPLSLS